VGTFLSGGTDSSTVSGMLRESVDGPVHAYSIGFDADGYDEMEYARIAARRFGLTHHEHYLSPEEVAMGMPLVATHYDQPFGNSSAVAAYHCARVARQDGRTALLAGDGGDELFGGNARYAKQSLFGLYERVPAPLRSLLMQPLLGNALARNVPAVAKAASYVQQARVPMPDRLHMYNLLVRLGLDKVLTPSFLAQVNPDHDREGQRAEYARSAGAHLVNRMLAYDWKYTLADNDLPKVTGTTTLASLATAFPLLADEVIDFSLKLPADYKLRGQQLRWFFKEALRGFLPDEIITKKKQGFGLPFGVWALKHPVLAKLADDALGSFGTRGVVQPGFLHRLRTELLPAHPGYYGELVWILAMLELWLRERAPRWRLSPS
jgi:asparagine synthase (glutamine-hydrolysing)